MSQSQDASGHGQGHPLAASDLDKDWSALRATAWVPFAMLPVPNAALGQGRVLGKCAPAANLQGEGREGKKEGSGACFQGGSNQ